MSAENVLEKVRTEIIESGRDTRYTISAYSFILGGLEFYLSKIGQKRHVSGQELSHGLLEFALKQFGPLSRSVLERMGITSTSDFGFIVYNLIAIGQMSRCDEDSLEDFFDVVDLPAWFEEQDYFRIDPQTIKGIRGA